MKKSQNIYQELLADLRQECDEMVRNGECTQEDADLRFEMKKDEILWSIQNLGG